MASLTTRLGDLACSPKGRQLTEKAQEYANKPENRRKIEEVRAKLAKKC